MVGQQNLTCNDNGWQTGANGHIGLFAPMCPPHDMHTTLIPPLFKQVFSFVIRLFIPFNIKNIQKDHLKKQTTIGLVVLVFWWQSNVARQLWPPLSHCNSTLAKFDSTPKGGNWQLESLVTFCIAKHGGARSILELWLEHLNKFQLKNWKVIGQAWICGLCDLLHGREHIRTWVGGCDRRMRQFNVVHGREGKQASWLLDGSAAMAIICAHCPVLYSASLQSLRFANPTHFA